MRARAVGDFNLCPTRIERSQIGLRHSHQEIAHAVDIFGTGDRLACRFRRRSGGGRAGLAARRLQDRYAIHRDIAGWRDDDRAIWQGRSGQRLFLAILGAPSGRADLLDAKSADYPAGFRFTNNSQWLVRMQPAGAGYADLYLYRLGPSGFVAATKKPLSDLAWDYFNSRPETRKIAKPNLHISANLLKGVDDNYKLARREAGRQPLHCHHAVRRTGSHRAARPDPAGAWLALPLRSPNRQVRRARGFCRQQQAGPHPAGFKQVVKEAAYFSLRRAFVQ